MAGTTIYVARRIVTMNPSNPVATHVAVRDGRILGAGPLDELTCWGDYTLDITFADHVLVPGFVEAHSHILEGALWRPGFHYIGFFPRKGPQGRLHGGIRSIDELIAHLRELDAAIEDPDEHLLCWGLDPLYFPGERLTAEHLDRVSDVRPILLVHASFHLATVNTAMMRAGGITADTETEGVLRDGRGEPIGELQEMSAMFLAPGMQKMLASLADPLNYDLYAAMARNAGITTATDLGSQALARPASVAVARAAVAKDRFPMRLVEYPVPARTAAASDPEAIARTFLDLKAGDTPNHRFGGIKIIGDGSIQGFTAVMKWPGYVHGQPNGLWQVDPDVLDSMVAAFHKAGINVHIHANGDETVEATIDAVDKALRQYSWLDHRHTVQHCQLTTSAQYRRMARLGMCANIFANHIWFWGDQHYASTVGPERANRMESCATAKREGVRFSIHSDANVTPIGQLHTMWCAVNRVTPSGRVLGEHERISAHDALQAVTLDAAYQLHMDHEIGSIEVGKWADFAVLEQDPLEVDPMAIRDIPVWGTVVGGDLHPAATAG
jgi:predicted amidohydrolase YtcJ